MREIYFRSVARIGALLEQEADNVQVASLGEFIPTTNWSRLMKSRERECGKGGSGRHARLSEEHQPWRKSISRAPFGGNAHL